MLVLCQDLPESASNVEVIILTDRQNELTGYPSIDKPWLKYYKEGVFEKALNTPKDKSFYRFYMENVFTKPDFPILKYFNTTISTKEFVDLIELWARAFRAVGVTEDEMVPVYGTWCPDIAAIFFALNAIGAHPYFEKLDITEEALRTETAGAKVGVVFEPLWNRVAKAVFGESRFEKVFMVGLSDSMSFPLKQIIALKSRWQKGISDTDKYIFRKHLQKLASQYNASFEVPFKKDRTAVITTSSGTTSSVVKGIMDTNEGALANVIGTALSEPGFFPGKECLITLPPTASTAINCFYLLPLYMGMTVRIDPRADEANFVKLILKYKPSLACATGSLWYSFFRRIKELRTSGKKIDLSFLDTFILGGSGVTPEQLAYINDVAKECNIAHSLTAGYGCSEFFGVITVDKYEVDYKGKLDSVIDVGIPIPGSVVSIFDDNGKELQYGKRGEIWAKGPSIMHGYFGKPEISKQIFDGEWLKTGDIGEIDENGYIYCYGRMKSSVVIDGKTVYLFDIANSLRKEFELEDCMAEVKSLVDGAESIVIYYVQKPEMAVAQSDICVRISEYLKRQGIIIDGYREFKEEFPISPTTLKPRTRYTDGFVNYTEYGEKQVISYLKTNEDDVWDMKKTIIV